MKIKTNTEIEKEKQCEHNKTREKEREIIHGKEYITIQCLKCEKEWDEALSIL